MRKKYVGLFVQHLNCKNPSNKLMLDVVIFYVNCYILVFLRMFK